MQGLSGRPGRPGVVQLAVTVFVLIENSLVIDKFVRVITLLEVVVIACGVIVLVAFATPVATTVVERGPVVMISSTTEVLIWVETGVEVMLNVRVGVSVLVWGLPTVRYRSLTHAKG